MLFTPEDLESALGVDLLTQAEAFLKQRTFRSDVRRDGGLVTALIQLPTAPSALRVYVRCEPSADGAIAVTGECTCRQRTGCVHIAAALLRALGQEAEEAAAPPAAAQSAAGAPQATERRLLYLIHFGADFTDRPQVRLMTGRPAAVGYDDLRDYVPRRFGSAPPPSFLNPADVKLVERLAGLELLSWIERYPLRGSKGAGLLRDMLKTGRAFLNHAQAPLALGARRAARFCWQVEADGWQFPRWVIEPEAELLSFDRRTWYLDRARGECGPLKSDLPGELAGWLKLQEGVAPDEVAAFEEELEERFPDQPLPRLRRFEVQAVREEEPRPQLLLFTHYPEAGGAYRNLARLAFAYGSHLLLGPYEDTRLDGDRVYVIERDSGLEDDAREQLAEYGLRPLLDWEGEEAVFWSPDEAFWYELQASARVALERAGWRLEVDPGFRARLYPAGGLGARYRRRRGKDWFDFGLTLEVDGGAVNLLPLLLDFLRDEPDAFGPAALRRRADDDQLLLTLDDGRRVALPFGRMRGILDVLYEYYQGGAREAQDGLALDRFRGLRLAELAADPDTPIRWEGTLAPLEMVERLRCVDRIPPATPPASFRAELRPYQKEGLAWLQFLREYDLGGVLADDMGLGKTVQALAHLALEKAAGRAGQPTLVIAPTSLVSNWRREAEQFAPELKVLVLHGAGRKALFREIPRHDLVITTYPLLMRDEEVLASHEYHLLILDEAHVIKNPKSKASRAVRELSARHRLCLTGTPLENHLGELWSLFDFLLPGFLGNQRQFRRLFRNPIEKDGDDRRRQRLARRVRPFLLRRTKEKVLQELPPKTEMIRSVQLHGQQRDLYETIRTSVHLRVREEIEAKGVGASSIVILDALLKLRQVCCDPRLVKLEQAHKVSQSAKLNMLMDLLPEMIDEGRRVLLFSQFTEMLALIETQVQRRNIPYAKLTGHTRDREGQVDRFQNGAAPLFLISLKAGGMGLNLTAADTVIHYDPWWNPAVERQATDRAHRIGQDKPVFVYKMLTEGTVEEKIAELQRSKQDLADGILDEAAESGPRWRDEEIEELFAPLED